MLIFCRLNATEKLAGKAARRLLQSGCAAVWETARITSDPSQAPKAIHLSEVRGSWSQLCGIRGPTHQSSCTHTLTHTQAGRRNQR